MKRQDITLYNSPVVFIDEAVTDDTSKKHTYWLGDKQLQGITSTLLVRALGDPYASMKDDPRALANRDAAAQRGSNIHEDVRTLCNFGGDALTLEGRNFIKEFDDRGWQVIANEYIVSDEEAYASSIDLLFLDDKGDLCIGDIKTYSATTAKAQLQRVALQCAIYNLFFSLHNNYKVKHHYEVRLRNGEVDIVELPMIGMEVVAELVNACKTGDEAYQYNSTPMWYYDMEAKLDALMAEKLEIDFAIDQLKADLMGKMKEEKLTSLRNMYNISICKGRVTQKVDEKKLNENPDLAMNYMVQTIDTKAVVKDAKKDEALKDYIIETVGNDTLRVTKSNG